MPPKKKTIEETYQKKSQLEHVLLRPGMYIGDIERINTERWVLDENRMTRKSLTFSPGLYKIFDEIFTNSTDHSQRDSTMKKIEVTISDNGEISILNDGSAIPIEIHKELKKYVPEIIFGEFHTSSNYDDTEARTVGGLNGYGAKLTNAFSKKFTVDICDGTHHFIQTWENNMSVIGNPKVTTSKKKSYTRISFIPDFNRFGMENMDSDTISLFKTRVYEGSAVTDKSVSVHFNGQKVLIKSFHDFTKLFVKEHEPVVYEKMNERWEFAVTLNPYDKFTQVSFVNGISTSEGGTHVDLITNQIIYKLKEQLEKKHKDITIRPAYIKDNMLIFVNCLIENPVFSSQTKENHVTKINKFGSKCELSDEIIKKIEKLGITANVVDIAKAKENKSLSKTDGTKKIRLTGIPKLDDANKAGGSEGYKCKLILTEGDSAKASAIAGLSVVGRDYYGVFPLRGKLLNVRDATAAQLLKNEEINCLKKIMGLQQGKEYNDLKSLRYGGIIIFTDADNDGSHIKGLIINWVHTFWPSLLKIDSFISSIVTPIVKVSKGVTIKSFYTQVDFNTWKESNDPSKWQVKYYKGLGTSTAKEAKEYFSNLAKQTVVYNFTENTDNDLIKAFKKGFEDQRKEWIKESTGKNYNLDHTILKQSISQFVNQELINFSIADLERSIPNMMDGFKPSQRKVLYACLKKGLYSDMKVAQLSGYISEHTSYHHGETSLQGTIVNMAQDFVGSNNINLLVPSGQFGCMDPETPVFLWNGIIEKAKNIKIGDVLIGDDGTKRIVSKLTSGIDDMYEITNGHMDSYIVNSHHILTICFSQHKKIHWKKSNNTWRMEYFDDISKTIKYKSESSNYNNLLEFSKSIPDNNIFDINVQQYLSLPKSSTHYIKGILNSSVIQWGNQETDIEPYILGMWLGDGMSDGHSFASMDSELVKSWAIWLDTIGCEVCHTKNTPPHESHSFYIRRRDSSSKIIPVGDKLHSINTCIGCLTSSHIMKACSWSFEKCNETTECTGKNVLGHNVVNMNPFKELLKKNNLFKNKHVPHSYIFNSEENRLKILAGIIDTDGCLKNQNGTCHYEISQCKQRKHLLESFRIIAGSLGYRAKIYDSKGNMSTLHISGYNLEKIPVKLERKKITRDRRITNCMYHGINVNYIGKGEYCGWNIDKNERFLLGDFTITHNTRITGGKDSASPRYIFTHLQPIAKTLFNEHDNVLLDYLDDDGMKIEPKYYIPLIPMILVNGSEGIGTGYSTNIPCYNPVDIIANLNKLIESDGQAELTPMTPWYRGFTGKIELEADSTENRYITTGVWKRVSNSIEISELPIGKWTQNYKEFLESLIESNEILDYRNASDDKNVSFKVMFQKTVLDELETKGEITKKLKLTSYINTSNMHVFDEMCAIRKVHSAEEIIDRFYRVRKNHFIKRKKYLIDKLSTDCNLLEAKVRFIKLVIEEKVILFNKKKDFIVKQLLEIEPPLLKVNDSWDYLLELKIHVLTEEKIKDLETKMKTMKNELETLKATKVKAMWSSEISLIKW
jgi:DNA gyrase/topoisomerase IV subunit B